jgi:predicted acyltransferase
MKKNNIPTKDNEVILEIAAEPKERVISVDVLGGFDMFWLVGGAGVLLGVSRFMGTTIKEGVLRQLEHAKWEGFYFYDLIFPLFVFLAGMSIVFSMSCILKEKGKAAALRRLLRRCTIMFLLGILYSGGFSKPWPEVRIMGVLQRIALCCLFAGILFCFLDWKWLIITFLILLLGYWFILSFLPLPGHDSISWAEDANWSWWFDMHYLPGHKHYETYDPEGILSTIPAVCTCLIGIFAGLSMKSTVMLPWHKAAIFFLIGMAVTLLGYYWGHQCPIIKKIWTPSFVFVAGGYSLMLLGSFYFIVDILKIRFWTAPFIWIGVNPLTIYLARNLIEFNKIAERFVGGSISGWMGEDGGYLLKMSMSLLLSFLLVWILNKKRIYLRL